MAVSRIKSALDALHQRTHYPESTPWILGASAVAALLVTITTAMPGVLGTRSDLDNVMPRLTQTREALAKLKAEKADQANKLAALEAQKGKRPEQTQEGYTEGDVAYWRKQLDVFGAMAGMQLRIVGRGKSPYTGAIKVSITLEPAAGTLALSTRQIAVTLDFLQSYGYVESFNGREAVVHISGPVKAPLERIAS